MQTFSGLDDYAQAVGTHLGYSDWRTITQEQVNIFADATDDHQWIPICGCCSWLGLRDRGPQRPPNPVGPPSAPA